MATDLADTFGRLAHCRDLISDLNAAIEKWASEAIEYTRVPYPAVSTAKYAIKARMNSEPPVSLRSQTGIIANELRAILDGIVTVLAERNSGHAKRAAFPICETKEKFENEGRKSIKLLSMDDQESISQLMSYGDGRRILWQLHRLDIERKHIRLQGAGASGGVVFGNRAIAIPYAKNGQVKDCDIGGVKSGTIDLPNTDLSELGKYFPIAVNIPNAIKATAIPGLICDVPGFEGFLIIPFFSECADIIEEFARRFD